MQCGGNLAAQNAFGEYVLSLDDIHAKYTSKAAQHYKAALQSKVHRSLSHQRQETTKTNVPLVLDDTNLLDTSNNNNTNLNNSNCNNDANMLVDVDPIVPITRPKTDAEFFAMWENAEPDNRNKQQERDEEERVSSKRLQPATTSFKPARHSAKTGVTKLGARKAQAGMFNYEEAQEREKELEEAASKPHRFSSPSPLSSPNKKKPISTRLMYQEENSTTGKDKSDDKNDKEETDAELDRLGMGVVRIGKFNGQVSNGGNGAARSNDDTEVTYARDKFGNAKSISSDQYFGRNEYGPSRVAANAARLARFQGATSISSDQYFDREPKFQDDVSSGYIRGTSTYATGGSGSSSNFSKKLLGVASRGAAKVKA